MKELIVGEENSLKRLDIYLTEVLGESRNFILKNIKSGKILVNGSIVKGGYALKEGDKITINDLSVDTDIKGENIPLDILYEDDDIIVVNKKSGMVVHPGSGNYSGTLVNALIAHTEDLSDEEGTERCGIVHRIEKETARRNRDGGKNKQRLRLCLLRTGVAQGSAGGKPLSAGR